MTPGQFTILTISDLMGNVQQQLELSIAREDDPAVCAALMAMLRQVSHMRNESITRALACVRAPEARREMLEAARSHLPTIQ
jgi:hypothetical protein